MKTVKFLPRLIVPALLVLAAWFFNRPTDTIQAAPNKPGLNVTNYVYVFQTNYVYTYFNQTNWVFSPPVTNYVLLQVTNTVNYTNHVNTTVTLTQTNYFSYTNFVPFPVTNWVLPNPTNPVFYGTLTMSNNSPGLIQTYSGTNVTGHLP